MDDYKVIRAIGKGSFGKVYLTKFLKDNRQYVMKVIKLKGIPPKEREACRNEVELMKRLAHPNIVAYKDSFFANGKDNLCIVMQFCDGGDLSGRLAASGGALFKEDQIMHWFVQIALAIHYMHENKVLHRDIKTQNIFLLGNGRLVLGDLGISKMLDNNAQFASTQIGTPYYMSPELFKSKPYAHKSDVWALGCVLYELCTLHHPFDSTSLPGLAAKIGKGTYTPISPKYSQALHSVIKGMLALEPKARPSVAEVLQQPYLKKHIYNFLKDIAERAALGLGAAPPSQVMAGKMPISEGTMVFRAAAGKAAGSGVGAEASAVAAAAAGLGPHASNLQAQLVSLGLKDIVVKALADAMASAAPGTAGAAAPAGGVQPPVPALKPAFSLANLAPPVVVAAVPAAAAAPLPVVLGPDGRPVSPNRVRKNLKEQQAALQREEERKRAVELALGRLKEEKDLRSKQREEARRKGGVGVYAPPAPLSAALAQGQAGGQASAAALAAARAYIAAQPSAAGGAGKGAGSAPVAGGLPPRSAVPVQAVRPSIAPAAIAIAGVAAGGVRGSVVAPVAGARAAAPAPVAVGVPYAGGRPPTAVAPSAAGAGSVPSSAPNSRPSSSGSGAAAAPGAVSSAQAISALSAAAAQASAAGDKDRAADLRERAERIRRDAAALEAAKRVRTDAAVAKAVAGVAGSAAAAAPSAAAPSSGPASRNHSPAAGIAAAAAAGPRAGSAAPTDRQRVADLDSWERDKGVACGGLPRSSSVGAMGAAPIFFPPKAGVVQPGKAGGAPLVGVAALAAAVAAQGMGPTAPVSRGPSAAPSREPSVERAVAAAGAVVKTGVAAGVPPSRVAPTASVASTASGSASSVSTSVASRPGSSSGADRGAAPGRGAPITIAVGGAAAALPRPILAPAAALKAAARPATSAGLPDAPSTSSSRAPSPAPPATASASDEARDGSESSKARVLAQKEARKRFEEETERLRLEGAAREGLVERQKATYQARESLRGIGAAIAGSLPVATAVLDASKGEADRLVRTLTGGAGGEEEGEGGTHPSAPVLPPGEYEAPAEEEDEVGASTGRGQLPADLDADSEDEVWEQQDRRKAASAQPAPAQVAPAVSEEEDEDIGETETALRAELARSTLRCVSLRQSLHVARRVAEAVGVAPSGSSSKARRSSTSSAVSSMATAGPAPVFALPPAAYGSARPTIVDDRPIRPAPVGGVPALPPRSGSVLAPSAAATAAAGGYRPGGSGGSFAARAPSPTPTGGKPTPAAPVPATPPAAPEASPVAVEEEDDGEEECSEEEEEELEDEDDLRDEDGDEEGQVAFAAQPRVSRTPAGKPYSGTIREEEEEDDDDDDDSAFGGEFKARLGLDGEGGDGGGGPGRDDSGGRTGGLSSRVEDLRRRCIASLGQELYEVVYAAVREVTWDGGSEAAAPGADPEVEEVELAALPARLGLTPAQALVVQDVALLLQMQQDLL